MRSDTLPDRRSPIRSAPAVRDLLVLWQHPDTREITAIGRLAHDSDTYSFAYTRGAASIQGFRPLPGLENLRQRYESQQLPPIFGQRVMEPDRPDYTEYLLTIGLDPATATPWEQIVQSGGARAGDTLQFMQVPTVSDGRARARFLANGVRHIPDRDRTLNGRTLRVSAAQHEAALRSLSPGEALPVTAETDNPEDAHATLVTVDGCSPLGYVPRVLSASIRELMDAADVSLTVARVGAPDAPAHLRLVLDLDLAAPPKFEFDRAGRWVPLSDQ